MSASPLSSDSDDSDIVNASFDSDDDVCERLIRAHTHSGLAPIRVNVTLPPEWEESISSEFANVNSNRVGDDVAYVTVADAHKSKNRYRNIIPLRHSHVSLPNDKYINASYICGKYIATQGPLENTVDDFWRMVYDEGTHIVVMLCDVTEGGGVKCYPYYPNEHETKIYGEIKVRSEYVNQISEHVVVHKLMISETGSDDERELYHFQYLGWPDFSVPESTDDFGAFVDLYRRLRKTWIGDDSVYCVVHCSAGIGRTGSFITIDIGIDMLMSQQSCDVVDIVQAVRHDRLGMIQNDAQYLFVYRVLLQNYILYGSNVDNGSLIYMIKRSLMDKLDRSIQPTPNYGLSRRSM